MLTDGCVSNVDEVVQCAYMARDRCRVFTFGVGKDCDKVLVKHMAECGRGDYAFITDKGNLKSVVVRALANAGQPSLRECSFKFGLATDQWQLRNKEVFRHELFQECLLMKKSDFPNLETIFKSTEDPMT